MSARLKELYDKNIKNELYKELACNNINEVPKLEKVVLNMGLGEDASDGKKLKSCVDDMSLITGQKPIITKFKKSISNFNCKSICLGIIPGSFINLLNIIFFVKSSL